jgi:hypothetical protein
MSHWFDRLATWSAEGEDGGEAGRLTRRQAVAAAAGVGAAGILASPLLPKDCARQVNREFEKEASRLEHKYLDSGNGVLSIVTVPFFLLAYSGLVTGAFIGQQHRCGVSGSECKKVPSGSPPPPKQQPCAHRGGLRLRGDQCEGPGAGAEGGSGCGGGTSSCPVPGGGDLCCFGSDLCCSGCCCIAEVGCGCCGG